MYEVTVKKNIVLEQEEATDLMAEVMRADFDFISQEINELRCKRNLQSYEVEDLRRAMEVREAMKTLLSYYMTHNSYQEFMELQRVYGNVE